VPDVSHSYYASGVSAHKAALGACAGGHSGPRDLLHHRAMQPHDVVPEGIYYRAAIGVW